MTPATWETSTPQSFKVKVPSIPKLDASLPFNHHEQTQAPKEPAAEGATPETVFLRQRFHNLRIESRVENTAYEIRDALVQQQRGKKGEPYILKSSWNLFLRPGKGATSSSQCPHYISDFFFSPLYSDLDPLVASGSIQDTLTSDSEGCPLISHRKFTVDRISSPENMRPERLPLLP